MKGDAVHAVLKKKKKKKAMLFAISKKTKICKLGYWASRGRWAAAKLIGPCMRLPLGLQTSQVLWPVWALPHGLPLGSELDSK